MFGTDIPWFIYFLNGIVLLLSLFLILLVLIQRGKGGGLSGAFGGVGGSSAFGSRAGDMFTKITIGVAGAWIILTMIEVVLIQNSDAAKRAAVTEPSGVRMPLPPPPID